MSKMPALPQDIEAIQQEVGLLSGASVQWINNPGLKGAMMAEFVKGVPTVSYRDFSDCGAAEELLHLRLRLKGYPSLSCPKSLHLEFQTAGMLINLLDHRIIFPILMQMGLDRQLSECRGTANQLPAFENIDRLRFSNEPYLISLAAIVYVRAIIDCEDKNIHALAEKLIQEKEYRPVQIIAQPVLRKLGELGEFRGKSVSDFRKVLKKCVGLLKLSSNVVIITNWRE